MSKFDKYLIEKNIEETLIVEICQEFFDNEELMENLANISDNALFDLGINPQNANQQTIVNAIVKKFVEKTKNTPDNKKVDEIENFINDLIKKGIFTEKHKSELWNLLSAKFKVTGSGSDIFGGQLHRQSN